MNGPVNIPGSDVKSVGVEYYISSEDQLGNYSRWPEYENSSAVSPTTFAPLTIGQTVFLVGLIQVAICFLDPFRWWKRAHIILSVLDPENKGPDSLRIGCLPIIMVGKKTQQA